MKRIIKLILSILILSMFFATMTSMAGENEDLINLSLKQKSEKEVSLSWDKESNVDGYEIYRKCSGGSYTKIKTITSAKTVTYVDKSLKLGKTYYYKIRGYQKKNGKLKKGEYSKVKKIKITYQKPRAKMIMSEKKVKDEGEMYFKLTVQNPKNSEKIYIDNAFVIEANKDITSEIYELRISKVIKENGEKICIDENSRVKVSSGDEVVLLCTSNNDSCKYEKAKSKVTICYRYRSKDYVYVKSGKSDGISYTVKEYLNTIM